MTGRVRLRGKGCAGCNPWQIFDLRRLGGRCKGRGRRGVTNRNGASGCSGATIALSYDGPERMRDPENSSFVVGGNSDGLTSFPTS